MSDGLLISAALIVRNEQSYLEGCLASLRGQVDEIVIVDTGSTDRTVEIANTAGARLLHHIWTDDFAKARNAALDAVSGDWVLYIDADERLGLPTGSRITDYLNPANIAAFVRFRPKTGYTRYRECRIFRNDPRIRFVGHVHETMIPDIQKICQQTHATIVRTPIEIDHLGYDGDQSQKHGRNLPMLRAEIEVNPGRTYLWYHLAETLAASGQESEAEIAAAEGLRLFQSIGDESGVPAANLIAQFLVRRKMRRGENSLNIINQGLKRIPDDYALQFLKAQAFLVSGAPAATLALLEQLIGIDPDLLVDGQLAFDRRIFEAKAHDLAAFACLALGRTRDAATHRTLAAAYAPS